MSKPGDTAPRPRVPYSDGLRLVGALAVVLIHVSSAGVAEFGRISRHDWWLCCLVQCACRWAVPVFLMLSGALLLDPARDEPLSAFFRRRTLRVGIPLVFWSAFYLLWRMCYKQEVATADWAWRAALFGTPYAHLFFLYLISGLYLTVPVWRAWLARATPREQWTFVALAFAGGFADKLTRTIWDAPLTAVLLFVPYLGYFLAGWCLRDLQLTRRQLATAVGVLALSIVVTALATRWAYGHFPAHRAGQKAYFGEYLSPTVIVMTLAAWCVLTQVCRWQHPVVAWLGQSMLGVYVIHPAVLAVLRDHQLTPTWHGALVGIPVSAILALAVSLPLTGLLRQVPGLRLVVGG